MPANFFIDSNIGLYILDRETSKFSIAKMLLQQKPNISTQVVAENLNVCLKKFKQTRAFSLAHARSLAEACEVHAIKPSTLTLALSVFDRYGYTIFDSLIIASALQANCSTLYSEDLHHGQVIEGKIKIVNPFVIV